MRSTRQSVSPWSLGGTNSLTGLRSFLCRPFIHSSFDHDLWRRRDHQAVLRAVGWCRHVASLQPRGAGLHRPLLVPRRWRWRWRWQCACAAVRSQRDPLRRIRWSARPPRTVRRWDGCLCRQSLDSICSDVVCGRSLLSNDSGCRSSSSPRRRQGGYYKFEA